MRSLQQTRSQVKAIISTGEKLYIISGIGTRETRTEYKGRRSIRAIMDALRKERWAADRWARIDTERGHALLIKM
jgi:hypothetical protein